MEHALIVSNALLWVAVVVLAGVVLALLRQIGVLHERVAPAGALMGSRGPTVGAPAPSLELEDWNGQRRRIGGAEPEGRDSLIFFVSPTCPVCKALLPAVFSIAAAEGARLLLASDGPRAEHAEFVREQRLERVPYLLSTQLGLAYGVERLPYAALVDAAGVLRARGLVNTREHLESLFEARERGVASVQELLARDAGSQRVA